jgi:glycyl-tRNA synthetase
LEIGTEELPAGDLRIVLDYLAAAVPKMFDEARLSYESLRVVGTPRRQAVLVSGLAPRQPDRTLDVQGPPAKVAFDAGGKPTRAAEGFAQKQGVPVEALHVVTEGDKAYVTATRVEAGRSAAEILSEQLPGLLAGLRFPKAMRWNQSGVAFSRPLRWLVALLGDQVIPTDFAGVSSGRRSRGLRPFGSPSFELARADDYLAALSAQFIVVDEGERREQIRAQACTLAASVGGVIPDDPDLLDEVANLVERPTALLGRFEPDFLTLPQDVLVTAMRKHQLYFPVTDPGGKLLH